MPMLVALNPFALLAPLFMLFELWQLVMGERYLGIRRIRANVDPRELPMPRWTAIVWSSGLIVYYLWMFTLLAHPVGRPQGFVLLILSVLAYAARSTAPFKWTLVILTFEGAVRLGMLLSLSVVTWRALLR